LDYVKASFGWNYQQPFWMANYGPDFSMTAPKNAAGLSESRGAPVSPGCGKHPRDTVR